MNESAFCAPDGETKTDGCGRFREALDDLEIALPGGSLHSRGVTALRKMEDRSSRGLNCHSHFHARLHFHPPLSGSKDTLTGLWVDVFQDMGCCCG